VYSLSTDAAKAAVELPKEYRDVEEMLNPAINSK
jgi:hypothetical protein